MRKQRDIDLPATESSDHEVPVVDLARAIDDVKLCWMTWAFLEPMRQDPDQFRKFTRAGGKLLIALRDALIRIIDP